MQLFVYVVSLDIQPVRPGAAGIGNATLSCLACWEMRGQHFSIYCCEVDPVFLIN